MYTTVLCVYVCLYTDHIWEWKDEHGNWNSYTAAHSELLEDAYSRKDRSLDFTVSGRGYTVDLQKMVQVNKATKVNRQVRRRGTGDEGEGEGEGEEPVVHRKPTKRSRAADTAAATEEAKVPKGIS